MKKRKRPNPKRDRIEIRAEPEWIDRIVAHANRLGMTISAYIRLACDRMYSDPEFNRPTPHTPERGGSH